MSEFAGMLLQSGWQGPARFTWTECGPGVCLPHHEHDLPFLSFLCEGSYDEGGGSNWSRCSPDDLTWHPAGDSHAVRHGGEVVRSLQIELDSGSEWCHDALQPLPRRRSTFRFPHLRRIVLDMYDELRRNDRHTPVALQGLLLMLFSRLGRECRRGLSVSDSRLVARVRAAQRDWFPGAPDYAALASSFGLTEARLAARYRRAAGETVGQSARQLRIERACGLLRDGNLSLAEIALDCGFHDQSHFTRAFARAMRCTPGRFRREVGG